MQEIYRFGPFELDVANGELRKRDRRLRLSASLTKLLTYFVTHPGVLITRQQIAACLWDEPQYVDIASGINTAVNRLRAALDDDPSAPIYIETSIGLGYRFVAPVERLLLQGQTVTASENAGRLANGNLDKVVIPADESVITDSRQGDVQDLQKAESLSLADAKFSLVDDTSWKESKPVASAHYRWGWVGGILLAVLFLACVVLFLRSHQRWPFLPAADFASFYTEFSQATFVDGGVSAATISHDGHMIAFVDSNGISVRIIDREVDRRLSSPPNLTVDRLTWLPGDSTLLASGKERTTGEEQVWLIYSGNTSPELLIHDAGESIASPDGGKIAFVRRSYEIWLADAHGQSQRRLLAATASARISSLLWAPNGNRLVCQIRQLPADAISMNSSAIEEARNYQWEYASLDAETGKILAQQSNIRFESAYLSRDGRMYFPETADDINRRSQLLMATTETTTGAIISKPKPVAELDGYNATSLSASDSGDQITALFERYSTSVYVASIHSQAPFLADIRRLIHPAPDNYPHAWTPSGDAVIFESNSLGKYSIFKQRLDGSQAELLVRSIGGAVLPQVTPDGKWLLFENLKNFRPNAIFRTPMNGGELTQVPTRSVAQEFACSTSSTGSCVVREKIGNDFVYFALDPFSGQGLERGRMPWIENSLLNWSLSPDGNVVAMPLEDFANPGIRLLMLDTGKPSRTKDILVRGYGNLIGVSWASPSSFYVQSKTGAEHSLLFVDTDGHAKVLHPSNFPTWGVPSRDRTRLAFVDQVVDTNVWLARRIAP